MKSRIALAVLTGTLFCQTVLADDKNADTNSPPRKVEIPSQLDTPHRLFLDYTQRRLEDYLIVPQVEIQMRMQLRTAEPWEYVTKQASDGLVVGVEDGFSAYVIAKYKGIPQWMQLLLAPYDEIRISSPLTDKGVPGFFGGTYNRWLVVPDILRRDPNITVLYKPLSEVDLNLRVSHETVDLVGRYNFTPNLRLVAAGKFDDPINIREPSAYLGLVYHLKKQNQEGVEYSRAILQLGITQIFDSKQHHQERKIEVSAMFLF